MSKIKYHFIIVLCAIFCCLSCGEGEGDTPDGPAFYSDLTITSFHNYTLNATVGQNFFVNYTAKNAGNAYVSFYDVGLFFSTDAECYWPSSDILECYNSYSEDLHAGESFTANASCPVLAGTPVGVYYVCGYIDFWSDHDESNENNNSRCDALAQINVY